MKPCAGCFLELKVSGLVMKTRGVVRAYSTQALEQAVQPEGKGFWNDVTNHRLFLEQIRHTFNISQPSDWYRIRRKQLLLLGARPLFTRYGNLLGILNAVYPEHNWSSSKFFDSGITPVGFWKDVEHQREEIETVSAQLGIKELSDWYKVSGVEARLKSDFLKRHSLSAVLKNVYPDYPWDVSRFVRPPRGYWLNKENILKQLNLVETKLGISQPEDWYSVQMVDLARYGLKGTTVTRSRIIDLLREKYPSHEWDGMLLTRGKYTKQRRLQRTLAYLFKGEKIKVNARKEAGLINPATNEYLELDIFLPSLNLAFEYQERHHFFTSNYTYDTVEGVTARDTTKMELAKVKGITIIPVPFWWDERPESLTATIHKARPHLLRDMPKDEVGIPVNIPDDIQRNARISIEGIGEPLNACFFTNHHADPTGWWIFEKYDGLRGFWNPETQAFYSRAGNKFTSFPQEVIDAMPKDLFLDGELWFGKNNFREAMKLAQRLDAAQIDWTKFKYMVWDSPNHKGTYAERYEHLERELSEGHKYIALAHKEICKDVQHLDQKFQQIIDEGGEGIILRDPTCATQSGRSDGYLKHKKYRDAEARIVKSQSSLQWECELPNGVTFTAGPGTTEFAKKYNPQPGDIVSFKHHGYLLASKKPKLPTLYRVRSDLTWDAVLSNWKERKSLLPGRPLRMKTRKGMKKPKRYWKDVNNRRQFFCEFAKRKEFDPHDVDNWANVTRKQVVAVMEGAGALAHYASLRAALKDTFPELTFNLKGRRPAHYWKDITNCRTFLDEFAQQRSFDPLIAQNWAAVTTDLLAQQGVSGFCNQHGGLRAVLRKAYPEVNFDEGAPSATTVTPRVRRWEKIGNCKAFFDDIAAEKQFDPWVPANWQSIDPSELLSIRGGRGIKQQHGSFMNALRFAYPSAVWPRAMLST